jgi:hypothetical protein
MKLLDENRNHPKNSSVSIFSEKIALEYGENCSIYQYLIRK